MLSDHFDSTITVQHEPTLMRVNSYSSCNNLTLKSLFFSDKEVLFKLTNYNINIQTCGYDSSRSSLINLTTSPITAFGFNPDTCQAFVFNTEYVLKCLYYNDTKQTLDEPQWRKLVEYPVWHPITSFNNGCLVAQKNILSAGITYFDKDGNIIWTITKMCVGRTITHPIVTTHKNNIIFATEHYIYFISHNGAITSEFNIQNMQSIIYSKSEHSIYIVLFSNGIQKLNSWTNNSIICAEDSSIVLGKRNRLFAFNNDKTLYCINRKNGHTLWNVRFYSNITCNMALSKCNNFIFLSLDSKKLYKLSTHNGEILWFDNHNHKCNDGLYITRYKLIFFSENDMQFIYSI